ncbi:MAG: AAA family ATPase, partial [Bacteroidetes bacterium]|nr:AAA family ATPase [Bacteroidota bacterium]
LFNEANIIAVQAHNRLNNLKKDRERTIQDLATLEEDARTRASRVDSLKDQSDDTARNTSALEIEISSLKERRGDLDGAVNVAKDSLMETKVCISDLEADLRELRRQREEAMAAESRQTVRQAEIKTRLQDLIATTAEDYEIHLTTHRMDIEADFSEKEVRAEILELRNKIRSLGPVNQLALESFDEEKERIEFLHEQLSDLERAESTLLETIGEINRTASERFMETFDAVRSNFQRLFIELFGDEAGADIVLMEPDNPLESEIEILAKPEGKKPNVLAQLSGGEKTLTAIALLFAIYLVKPSPFCILDEVDAPLDDANVDRFMHLIRSFSDSTQFILVTHNKRTMEAADRMYGITMQEQGVSKLVGVTFDSEFQMVA